MSLVWTIEPEKRLMTAVAEGDVTHADMDAFLDAMAAGGAISFRKFFDGRLGDTAMSPEDVLALGVRVRGYQQMERELGALAIVIPLDKMELVSRVVGILAIADRPMRVFTSSAEARAWIDGQASAPRPPRKTGRGPGRPKRAERP